MCNNNRKLVTFDKKSPMEEHFDRISDENYERIDREVMRELRRCDRKIDKIARYEKKPYFFYGFLHGCTLVITGWLIYYLATYLFGKM